MEELKILRFINKNDVNGMHNYLRKKYCKSVFIVEILETQERLGVRKGQWYTAENYWLDPHSKVTLIDRISKNGRVFKKKPSCNQYKTEVRRVGVV